MLVLGCAAGAAEAAPLQWATTPIHISDNRLIDVSCPAPTRCFALDSAGRVLVSDDPTGPESSWRIDADLPALVGNHVGAVTALGCADVCLAGLASGLHVLRDAAGTWRLGGGTLQPIVAASCKQRCITASSAGGISIRYETHWVGSGGPAAPTAVTCSSPERCVSVDLQGQAWTHTLPHGPTSPHAVTDVPLTAVACPSASVCLTTDGNGKVHRSLDPTRDGTWRGVTLSTVALRDVACASPALCAAIDDAGGLYASADPTGLTPWDATSRGPVRALDCAGAFCLAVDANGDVWTGVSTGGPLNTVAPSVAPAVAVNGVLTCDPGQWSGSPSLSIQWESGGVAIPGATSPSITAAPEGAEFNCSVTATNASGTAVARSGSPSVRTPLTWTSEPTLSGTARVGSTMHCKPGAFSSLTPVTVTYIWAQNGSPWFDAPYNGPITFAAKHVGQRFSCLVTGTNVAGSVEATSRSVTVEPAVAPFSAQVKPAKASLKTLLRRGLRVTASCSQACTLTLRITPDAKTARRLGVGRGTSIGTAKLKLAAGKRKTATVKLTKASVRAIERRQVRSLRFTVRAADAAKRPVTGGKTMTVRR